LAGVGEEDHLQLRFLRQHARPKVQLQRIQIKIPGLENHGLDFHNLVVGVVADVVDDQLLVVCFIQCWFEEEVDFLFNL
jgi:hypothetical protein